MLDQRLLPQQEYWLTLDEAGAVADAIRDMAVRGAPAIGISAAYGAVLAARAAFASHAGEWRVAVEPALERLADARPTAVNLFWALRRMRTRMDELDGGNPEPALLEEAQAIQAEDIAANHRMGGLGAALIPTGTSVLTHCNAGALATGGYGTALGVIRSAHADGRIQGVFADETRPWLQGSRLTAWELMRDDIPVEIIVEGAAAQLLSQGLISWVIVGSDRIAANGDVANKIGTYGLAILARHHGVPLMVVAPTSTVDMAVASGSDIPIEQRASEELLSCAGQPVAARGTGARNPVFDVTPAGLVDVIVTERGIVRSPDRARMQALMQAD